MFVSFRWLSELLPTANLDPVETADVLTALGLAVDGVTDHTGSLRPVILAEVVAIQPHPSRDSLRLVTIRTRDGATPKSLGSLAPVSTVNPTPEQLTVVCGAKNVPAPGGLVVFAGLGVKLPGVDFELTRRDIGGVISEGMLCSEAELGLAESSEGILTFAPGSYTPGTRFIDAFPEASDVIYELDVTPNRPDALGHVGVARDLSAFFEVELAEPSRGPIEESGAAAELVVDNKSPDRCPRYGAALVRGVKIAPAPDFMRWRLHRLGIRPISNVVDITNWLLMEYGQPLHAFDLRKVKGKEISIRLAQERETITTLDGAERTLSGDDLVICDASGPTALAGIMGGQDSEIGSGTEDVLLECAFFLPQGIRRTARRQSMHTESSHRFERGTDHGATTKVLERARFLLQTLAGGKPAPQVIFADGMPMELPLMELNGKKLDGLLGVNVPFKSAVEILGRLGLKVEYLVDTNEGPVASVRGASHRPDIRLEQDLIEEVARVRGLDNIPTVLPSIPPQAPRTSGDLERTAAETAVDLGLSEALTHAFVAPSDLVALHAPKPVVRLENPLSEDRSVLRTTLAPGLIEAVGRARRRGEPRIRLFSVGAIFLPAHSNQPASEARVRTSDDRLLPFEQPTFTAIVAGPRDEYLSLKPELVDIYDAKAIAIEMVERMTRKKAQVAHIGVTPETRHLHPRGAAEITVDGTRVGVFGPLHPDVIEHFDIDGPALLVELNLALIEAFGQVVPRYRPIPKLPAVSRDVSLVVAETTQAQSVADLLMSASGELCESVEIAAEFRGGSVPDGHRSLTFRLTYRDPLASKAKAEARTLTDKEVDAVFNLAMDKARSELGATLRG